jgi:hypothetical protein
VRLRIGRLSCLSWNWRRLSSVNAFDGQGCQLPDYSNNRENPIDAFFPATAWLSVISKKSDEKESPILENPREYTEQLRRPKLELSS